jgi:hypothetical protein
LVGKQPLKNFRSGNFNGAVWLNEKEVDGATVNFRTISLRRSWKDKDATWRDETINMRRQDIPKVMAILNKLQEEMYLTHQ